MEKRDQMKLDICLMNRIGGHGREGVQIKVAMRQHDAFRRTRGAARVKKLGHIIFMKGVITRRTPRHGRATFEKIIIFTIDPIRRILHWLQKIKVLYRWNILQNWFQFV
jgi:hypothetical protein